MWQQHCPSENTELVGSTEYNLHAVISIAAADHTFYVVDDVDKDTGTQRHESAVELAASQELHKDMVATNLWHQLLYLVSMAWALRIKSSAGQRCRASLVMRGGRLVPGLLGGNSGFSHKHKQGSLGSLAHGVSKSHFMEDRASYGVCLDISQPNPRLDAHRLLWLLRHSGEYCCVVRGGQVLAERLAKNRVPARQRRPIMGQQSLTSIVTGGTKGLGWLYAQQLMQRDRQTIVLTSRGGLLCSTELASTTGKVDVAP
jgi:hypothetical protein